MSTEGWPPPSPGSPPGPPPRRRTGLRDLPALMLPCWLLTSSIGHAVWIAAFG